MGFLLNLEVYASLFLTGFLAATFLPVVSEAALAGLAATGSYDTLWLFAVASFGNTLGSVFNWVLGRYLLHFQDRRWFPVTEPQLDRASRVFNKWGVWSLLLAWTPFLGDPLTFVAGILRVPFTVFFVLVSISKAGRYLVVLGLVERFSA